MFNRQWFAQYAQIGLTEPSLAFDQALRTNDHEMAYLILANNIHTCQQYWRRQYFRLSHVRRTQLSAESIYLLKIYWDGFWPNFNVHNNQLLDIFRASIPEISIISTDNPLEADVSFYSCYGNFSSLNLTRHTTRLLFLAENVRPTFYEFDYCFCSDLNTYGYRSSYLPLWFLHLDHFRKDYPDRSPVDISRFICGKEHSSNSVSNKISYIGNNNEPSRMNLIYSLRRLGFQVDEYGSLHRPIADKQLIYSQYRYIISPENSFYQGYVTEKLIDSYLSGQYFFYWGGIFGTSLKLPENMLYVDLSSNVSDEQLLNLIRTTYQRPNKFISPLFDISYVDSIMKTVSALFKGIGAIYFSVLHSG